MKPDCSNFVPQGTSIGAPTILSATHGVFYAKYFGATNSISASGKTLISGTSQGSANKVFLTAL